MNDLLILKLINLYSIFYIMLNKDELLRLQKLAAISLDQQESEKLLYQLWTIVDFLGTLKNIPVRWNAIQEHSLEPISWIKTYQEADLLFNNVTHEKIGNSIVVNSVINN